jgi:hypothetical protein
MIMKTRTLLLAMVGLLIFVFVSCTMSEISWAQPSSSDSLRQLVGLPSFAVGNLNPSARNPGLEFFCTALYDTPGGYCYYFTSGVPSNNLTIYASISKDEVK